MSEKFSFRDELTNETNALLSSTDFDEKNFGNKVDTLFLVNALCDNLATGTPIIIGFTFRSSEPLIVPKFSLTGDSKSKYDVQGMCSSRSVDVNEEFCLNYVETALLLARPEYNCRVSGDGVLYELSARTGGQYAAKPSFMLRVCERARKRIKSIADLAVPVVDFDKRVVYPKYEDAFGEYLRRCHSGVLMSCPMTISREKAARNAALATLVKRTFCIK